MPARDRSHYTREYHLRAKAVRDAAYADPLTRCWRCGLTLAEHPPHKSGRPASWHAGHTVDGDNRSPLMPEGSTCNTSAGASMGNALRADKGCRWW